MPRLQGFRRFMGLYGSVFPIILFGLFSTSPQFIFGVDAAPAALIGAALVEIGIQSGSEQAMAVVPVLTFFVAVWLFIFAFFKAGKLVNYISAPVMGGFITGICTTIILMQVPKLMGGTAGTGELSELAEHIWATLGQINLPSLILGLVSLVILLVMKKILPKFPMVVVLMAAGVLLSYFVPISNWGIRTLDAVEPGLPVWSIPDFSAIGLKEAVIYSLSIAVVIMAETLLGENSFAQKNGYRVNANQELVAFSMGNLAAALTGCCPINGSVSRTAISEQYQGKTQLTGIVAGISMILVLLGATGLIAYLPVPMLTAIVISSLLGATEFDLAVRLRKISKKECLIYWGAFWGVLTLGTINGVLIGIILSFAEMIIRTAKPARCFLGVQPGHRHFEDLTESLHNCEIEGVVIYRFSSSLFFANIDILQQDIENAIGSDTKAVILDASGIGSIDVTAADRLAILYRSLKSRGIRFYITEHIAELNEQMRALGLGFMIEEGRVRRTIHVALKDMGIHYPYPLKGNVDNTERSPFRKRVDNSVQEFVWAFGSDSEAEIEKQIRLQIEQLKENGDMQELLHGQWNHMDELDADAWDTKAVILDASGIGSIDVTAADRLAILYRSLKSRGIRFYITEHIAELNEQMRALGLGFMIEEGRVRRTIHVALKDMGIHYPYPLKGNVDNTERSPFRKRVDNSVQEFVWAFGSDSEAEIEKQIRLQIEQLKENGDMQELLHGQWNHMDELDADAWIEHLEEHMKEIVKISGQDEQELTVRFEKHRKKLREQMMKEHPELVAMFEERRRLLDEQLERKWPDVYALVLKQREKDSRLK